MLYSRRGRQVLLSKDSSFWRRHHLQQLECDCDIDAPAVAESLGPIGDIDDRSVLAGMKRHWPGSLRSDYSETRACGSAGTPIAGCKRKFTEVDDLFRWPQCIAERHQAGVGEETVKSKIRSLLSSGVMLSTHYSGVGMAEDAAAFALTLASRGVGLEPKRDAIVGYSSCDLSKACRSVLMRAGATKHVFGDLLSRVSVPVLQKLTHKLVGFRARLDAECHVDIDVDCDKQLAAAAARRSALIKRIGSEWFAAACDILGAESFSEDTKAYCYKCRRMCLCFPSAHDVGNRVLVEVSGTTCVAWSSMSRSALGWLHDSSIPFLCWARMVQFMEPHLIVHECVPRFDFESMSVALGGKYDVSSSVFSPCDIGFPSRRPRRYTVCVLKGARRGLGQPEITWDTDLNLQGFAKVACRTPTDDGIIFMQATEEQQTRVYCQYAATRHWPGMWCKDQAWSWYRLLCPGDQRRLLAYGRLVLTEFASADAPFMFVNITQNANYMKDMGSLSSFTPALMRSSRLFICTPDLAWRPVVPEELFAVQGLPMFGEDAVRSLSPLAMAIHEEATTGGLSMVQLRQLAGNSMHHAAVGAVLLDALLRTHVRQ